MYFVISAGGTAGHINPALAICDELKKCGHDILFVGTSNHMESRLAPKAGFDFCPIDVSGFDKAKPLTLITALLKMNSATNKIKKLFQTRRPDAVVGFGAYVSLPVGNAAKSMNIPLAVHEQNSLPGMANKQLAKSADLIALTYEYSKQFLHSKVQPRLFGNPVRAEFESASSIKGRKSLNIPDDAIMLLVMGGSLGAKHINQAICSIKDDLLALDNVYVVQSSGKDDYDSTVNSLNLSEEQKKRWKVKPYIDNMAEVLHAADFVVSRAGASALAEIMSTGTPAILVPFPFARGDHQTYNAKSCVEAGAAVLVSDDQVEGREFKSLVLKLATDSKMRSDMHDACMQFSGSKAREKFAKAIINLAKKGLK